MRDAISLRPSAVLLSPRPCQITTGRGVSSEEEVRCCCVPGVFVAGIWANASGHTTKALVTVRSATAMVEMILYMAVALWLIPLRYSSRRGLTLTVVSRLPATPSSEGGTC